MAKHRYSKFFPSQVRKAMSLFPGEVILQVDLKYPSLDRAGQKEATEFRDGENERNARMGHGIDINESQNVKESLESGEIGNILWLW
ncbi:hypothetical protein N7457_007538 [Penicillium paradoxum]|uniref:uncharacterized protein n=1 Tax=Penicillium paradoxum TaxID=176176 RepID=UPI002548333C|nr:uncharacterized protein N7457_007538 [Penicillium paradoxum]KAJ5779818.1 hypothetical protein N7457_007538 [Penicillium paradoxum]